MLEFGEDSEGASLAPENSLSLRLHLPYEMAAQVLTFSHLVLEDGGESSIALALKCLPTMCIFSPVSSNKKHFK